MGDWIDDLLQQGEKLPGIGDAIQKLQMVYDIWRNEPANPQPTRDQANNLNDLFQQAQQLRDHFNESLSNLRQKWSGNDAQVYLGPEVTAFEIEHAMEPGTTGTGYQLWNLLNQTTALLNYNAAAHDVGADKLRQIQEFHDELNTDFMIALGTLGMMLATAPIPGVDVVTDSVGAGAEIAEAGVAADDAIQLSRFMKLLKTVEDVVQDVTKVVKIYLPLIQFLAKAGAIATIATVTLLVLASIPSDSSEGGNTLQPPVALSPGQQKDLEQLSQEFPDVSPDDIAALLEAGFSPDEIRAILKAGFTHAQIMALVGRIRLAQQNGTDSLGLTADQIRQLVLKVVAALNSPDRKKQLEGQIARALIGDLVSFERKVYNANGVEIGEIDVETSNAIIEVTTSPQGKLQQLLKELNNPLMNPTGKQVILYAPKYSRQADQLFASYGIKIVRSLQELMDYLGH
jgi:hypothetical protein